MAKTEIERLLLIKAAAQRVDKAFAAYMDADTEQEQVVTFDELEEAMLDVHHCLHYGRRYKPNRRPVRTVSLTEIAQGDIVPPSDLDTEVNTR